MLEQIKSISMFEDGLDMELILTFIVEIPNKDFNFYSEQLDVNVDLFHDFMREVHETTGSVINTDSRCKEHCVECLFDSYINFKFKLDPNSDLEACLEVFIERIEDGGTR